jgi:DNA polymerase-1
VEKRYDSCIVDGNNLFFKSFSVHKDLSVKIDNKKIFTGGTFGLINMLITIKKEYLKEDSSIFICWDKGHKRRSEIYPEYKSNRNKDEWEDYENFKTQMNQAKYVLNILGIKQASKFGEEADDVCGTLSKLQKEAGKEVILVSADKDFQQLLDDSIDLLAHKAANNIKVWDTRSWEKAKGYHPKYFSYFLALNGDIGDNIPGVKGAGEVSSNKFIIENLDLLETILSSKDITTFIPEKQSAIMKKLISEEGQDSFRLSYKLSLIDKDMKGIKIHKYPKDMEKIEEIFETFKFNRFLEYNNWKILGVL